MIVRAVRSISFAKFVGMYMMVAKVKSHGSDRRIRGVTSYNSWNPKLVVVNLMVFGFWNDDVIIAIYCDKGRL